MWRHPLTVSSYLASDSKIKLVGLELCPAEKHFDSGKLSQCVELVFAKGQFCQTCSCQMIELFFSIVEHICPLLLQIAQMSLILPPMGSYHILPRLWIPPPTLFSTQQSHTPFANMYITPPQNTPFPGLNLKVGKMNYCPSVPLTTLGRAWLRTQKPLKSEHAKNFQYYQFGIKYYNSRTDNLLVFVKYWLFLLLFIFRAAIAVACTEFSSKLWTALRVVIDFSYHGPLVLVTLIPESHGPPQKRHLDLHLWQIFWYCQCLPSWSLLILISQISQFTCGRVRIWHLCDCFHSQRWMVLQNIYIVLLAWFPLAHWKKTHWSSIYF